MRPASVMSRSDGRRTMRNRSGWLTTLLIVLLLVAGCGQPVPTATPIAATSPQERETATLGSLEQVDDYPLYVMHYFGVYPERASATQGARWPVAADRPRLPAAAHAPGWACSLFAALGDGGSRLYGRNFDWEFSPALLLFTEPPDGYASVSMVDLDFLGIRGARALELADLPLSERRALLDAPFWPFDGMNERGLAIGMAAVPPGNMVPDPEKETVGSIRVIRLILDYAASVDEAVAILGSHNIEMGGGPAIHYLLADVSGRSVLVEFYRGEMVVTPNETPWHLATNFLRASAGESAAGQCSRYDRLSRRLTEAGGQMSTLEAMDLLASVAQEGTQWSIVYGMSTGEVRVSVGRRYDNTHRFALELASE
jgi:hypothetical protein